MQYFSIWAKGVISATNLLSVYFSDSAVVLKQQSQTLQNNESELILVGMIFFLLPEGRGGCVPRYLIQPQLMVCRKEQRCWCSRLGLLWDGVRGDTEHWSVWIGNGSGMAHPARPQWALCTFQLSLWGSPSLLHSPAAASSCGWYPGKLCGVQPQSMLDWEPGEQDCVLILATDSL